MTVFEYCMCIITGVVFVTLGVSRLRKVNSFKTEVRAVFVRNIPFSFKGTTRFSPVFEYSFNSVEVKNRSFQQFDAKELPSYVPGNTYTIYIDEKNPENFVVNRRYLVWDILLTALMLMLGLSSFGLLFLAIM